MTSSSNLSPSCIYIFSYFVFKSWANWMHPQVLMFWLHFLSFSVNCKIHWFVVCTHSCQQHSARESSADTIPTTVWCVDLVFFLPPLGFLIPNARYEKLNVNPRCDLNAFGNDWWLNIDTGTLNLLAVPRKTLFLGNELHFTAVHHWANAVTSSF